MPGQPRWPSLATTLTSSSTVAIAPTQRGIDRHDGTLERTGRRHQRGRLGDRQRPGAADELKTGNVVPRVKPEIGLRTPPRHPRVEIHPAQVHPPTAADR
jgi:hypothetical protein